MLPDTQKEIRSIIVEALRLRFVSAVRRPFVLGLCGAQGSGKSTLASELREYLTAGGIRTVVLSLDDLYLTQLERRRLASEVHPLLGTRGVPGTHDVALGERILADLGVAGTVLMPHFDKALDDRVPQDQFTKFDAPVDLILFEGWCVGARPQQHEALVEPVNRLERREDPHGIWRRWVNERLTGEYQSLFARIDMLVMLAAPGFDIVARWRTAQEQELRSARGATPDMLLDDVAMDRFVQHYQRLTEHILAEMPGRADILVRLDEQRRPQALEQP